MLEKRRGEEELFGGEGLGTMAAAAQPTDKGPLVGAHIPLTGEERIVYTQNLLLLGLVLDRSNRSGGSGCVREGGAGFGGSYNYFGVWHASL